jgi:hypothetical protein
MALATKYGLGVILVMHAAPGSQDGQDNGAPFKQRWSSYCSAVVDCCTICVSCVQLPHDGCSISISIRLKTQSSLPYARPLQHRTLPHDCSDPRCSALQVPSYPQQTTAVMVGLAARYASSSALLGLELMNEPTVRIAQPVYLCAV